MTDVPRHIRIDVLGPFRVTAEAGQCLTPKGAKNQALIALLALSPSMARPRRWLEDQLWSTFAPEQASANLRQALSKLKKHFGDHSGVLTSGRSTVSLDPEQVRVDLLESGPPPDARIELLQGMDTRDPEFEEWLRMERMALQARIAEARPAEARGLMINCSVTTESFGPEQFCGEILSNQIGENIAEQVRAWRQSMSPETPADAPSDVTIECRIVPNGEDHALFLKAVHPESTRVLYSKFFQISALDQVFETDEHVGRIVFQAADQIIGKLPQVLRHDRPESRSTALSRLGLYRMFSFEQAALREAANMMTQAHEIDANPIYLAWSSLIRLMQAVELAEGGAAALREEAVQLHHRSIKEGTDNPLVHAIGSKVRGIALRDTTGVMDHAATAVERNPASAFAWKSLAEGYMMAGDLERAFDVSSRACRIARGSPFKHWWDTGHCVIAVACGRPAEAIEAGEAAARSAPLSRPAHRHLLALYAQEGQFDKAQAVAEKLAKIEPGFSLDRFVFDETYPVRTLRDQGLLEPIKALL